MERIKSRQELEKDWGSILNDDNCQKISNKYRRFVTARLMENTKEETIKQIQAEGRKLSLLTETTETGQMDIVDPVLISLIRRTAPNLLAYDMAGVQPMNGPTGLIFALRAFYGAPTVSAPIGTPGDARSFAQSPVLDSNGETQAGRWSDAGVASEEAFYYESDDTFSGTGTQSANDGSAYSNSFGSYTVGTGISTATGENLGRGLSGDSDFNEMSFTIEKHPVEAKTRALKAKYTIELAQDLRAVHGLDAESELATILQTEILSEVNRELINTIRRVAVLAPAEIKYSDGSPILDSNGNPVVGSTGTFDLNVNSDGRWSTEKWKTLIFKINKEANGIAKATRRGRGNFLIVSSNVGSMLDLAGKMIFAPAIDNNFTPDDTGPTYIGMLQGRYRVYIDPYLQYDEVIVGYKGANQFDAGLFFCPYVPLQLMRAIGENTFQPALAFKTRYAIAANPFTTLKTNSNLYFRKFRVLGL